MNASKQNEVTKPLAVSLDGFAVGYSEPARSGDDGDGGGSGSGFPDAVKIKFDIHTAKWIDRDGNEGHKAGGLDGFKQGEKWGPAGGSALGTDIIAEWEGWGVHERAN